MTTKFLDSDGRVEDQEIAEEMAYIEKPFREANIFQRKFSSKVNYILKWQKKSEKFLNKRIEEKLKIEVKRIIDKYDKIEEELEIGQKENCKKDEEEKKKLEELMKIENKGKVDLIITWFEEKKWDMEDFEKRETERQTKLYEELTNIYETDWIIGLCSKLEVEYGRYDCGNAEGIIAKLFKINQREIFSPLIDKVAQIYITTDYFDDHSLCHLFERYSRWEEGYSFLDKPSLRETAELLANTAIIRWWGNLSRTLWAFTKLALEDIENWNLESFTFRPSGFDTEWLSNRFNREYQMNLIRFCESKTPREFMEKMGESEIKELTEKKKVKKTPEWIMDITCVDVDGTLIKDWKLYLPLVNKLSRDILSWKKVVIFSWWEPGMQTERLKELWLDEIFLPVVSKEIFKWVEVHTIIDDTEPKWQGLLFKSYMKPEWIN